MQPASDRKQAYTHKHGSDCIINLILERTGHNAWPPGTSLCLQCNQHLEVQKTSTVGLRPSMIACQSQKSWGSDFSGLVRKLIQVCSNHLSIPSDSRSAKFRVGNCNVNPEYHTCAIHASCIAPSANRCSITGIRGSF